MVGVLPRTTGRIHTPLTDGEISFTAPPSSSTPRSLPMEAEPPPLLLPRLPGLTARPSNVNLCRPPPPRRHPPDGSSVNIITRSRALSERLRTRRNTWRARGRGAGGVHIVATAVSGVRLWYDRGVV